MEILGVAVSVLNAVAAILTGMVALRSLNRRRKDRNGVDTPA